MKQEEGIEEEEIIESALAGLQTTISDEIREGLESLTPGQLPSEEQVRHKIDDLVEDVTADQIIDAGLDAVKQQLGDERFAQIVDQVNSLWEHIPKTEDGDIDVSEVTKQANSIQALASIAGDIGLSELQELMEKTASLRSDLTSEQVLSSIANLYQQLGTGVNITKGDDLQFTVEMSPGYLERITGATLQVLGNVAFGLLTDPAVVGDLAAKGLTLLSEKVGLSDITQLIASILNRMTVDAMDARESKILSVLLSVLVEMIPDRTLVHELLTGAAATLSCVSSIFNPFYDLLNSVISYLFDINGWRSEGRVFSMTIGSVSVDPDGNIWLNYGIGDTGWFVSVSLEPIKGMDVRVHKVSMMGASIVNKVLGAIPQGEKIGKLLNKLSAFGTLFKDIVSTVMKAASHYYGLQQVTRVLNEEGGHGSKIPDWLSEEITAAARRVANGAKQWYEVEKDKWISKLRPDQIAESALPFITHPEDGISQGRHPIPSDSPPFELSSEPLSHTTAAGEDDSIGLVVSSPPVFDWSPNSRFSLPTMKNNSK